LVLAVAVYEQTTPADDAVVMALTGASACIYGIGTVLSSVLVAKVSRIVTDKSEIKSLDDNE
jgi:ribosomal protein S13